jgi:hypothetical protein
MTLTKEELKALVGTGTAIHLKSKEEIAEFCKMAREIGFDMKDGCNIGPSEEVLSIPTFVWLETPNGDEWTQSSNHIKCDCFHHNGQSVEFSKPEPKPHKEYAPVSNQEPQTETPYKVGDKVLVCGAEYEISEVITAYRLNHKNPMLVFAAEELHPLPKTKKVFSLEKWVEKRMKSDGAKWIIQNIEEVRKHDGKPDGELVKDYCLEPDLFIEVAE